MSKKIDPADIIILALLAAASTLAGIGVISADKVEYVFAGVLGYAARGALRSPEKN